MNNWQDIRDSRTALMGFTAEAFRLRFSFYAIAGVLTLVLVGILPLWASRLSKKT
ncbi:MAG: hypothetical protein ABJN14_08975 [Paracoccaceae bacterium]